MTQGSNYGQGGSQFGPAGYAQPEYGGGFGAQPRSGSEPTREPPRFGHGAADRGAPAHHDESYRRWRDTQLDAHDRDYGHWRDEQARRYDEDYSSWRNDRHSAFSKEFEGWRVGRQGQPSPQAGVTGSAHGGNPALGDISDGGTGSGRHEARQVAQEMKSSSSHDAKVDPADAPRNDPAKH